MAKIATLKTVTPTMENLKVTIKPPRLRTVEYTLTGTAPYMQCAFSEKAKNAMMAKMAAGSQSKSKCKHEPRDYAADMRGATHFSSAGWIGVPAACFRAAMIDACRLVGFKMTVAKLAVFVEADGLDKISGQPLVKLLAGEPERNEAHARNDNGGCDIRVRPLWREWKVKLRMIFDEDVFSLADVSNLLARAGGQVGIGEGRPGSRNSYGIGFGTFKITGETT